MDHKVKEVSAGLTATQRRSAELNHLGVLAHQAGKGDAAYMHYVAALLVDDHNAQAWMNLGGILNVLQRHVAAEAAVRKAVEIMPDNPMFLLNLAASVAGQRRYPEAERMLEKQLRLAPDDPNILHNLGLVYYMQEKFGAAEQLLAEAKVFRPTVDIINDWSLARLAQGKDLASTLGDYEIRWQKLTKPITWSLPVPEWQGEGLLGKHILLHHEQGYGDSIMLSRFIPEVMAKGAKVTVCMPAPLVRLFQNSFGSEGNCAVYDWDSLPKTGYDYHSPLLSVMRWLGYNSPDEIRSNPYLKARPTIDLKSSSRRKIGICWSSGDHGFDMRKRQRKVELVKLLPLASISNVQLVSLQKDEAIKELEYNFCEALISNPMMKAEDFADTADIISRLDLVVSVDTSVAHLAGALGIPAIVLSPSPRCWRWWGKHHGLPWYTDMALCQQSLDGSWDDAIQEAISLATAWLTNA